MSEKIKDNAKSASKMLGQITENSRKLVDHDAADAITNIFHLADTKGWDIKKILRMAKNNYKAEKRESEPTAHNMYQDTCLHAGVLATNAVDNKFPQLNNEKVRSQLSEYLEDRLVSQYYKCEDFRNKLRPCLQGQKTDPGESGKIRDWIVNELLPNWLPSSPSIVGCAPLELLVLTKDDLTTHGQEQLKSTEIDSTNPNWFGQNYARRALNAFKIVFVAPNGETKTLKDYPLPPKEKTQNEETSASEEVGLTN